MKRTHIAIPLSAAAVLVSAGASAGQAAYSNFANFTANPGAIGMASAVTAANNPIITPFVSNTLSMRVMLDTAADIDAVRVLTPSLFVDSLSAMPPAANLQDGAGDLNPRNAPTGGSTVAGGAAGDPSSLAPLRVSIFASAADVESRSAFASVDFNAGEYGFGLWSTNNNFYEVGFDLGATFSLAAGEWFIEVAQIDPASAQFFLAVGSGVGLHRFDPQTLGLETMNSEFALELGRGVAVPLPTGGALAFAGLAALGARRRR